MSGISTVDRSSFCFSFTGLFAVILIASVGLFAVGIGFGGPDEAAPLPQGTADLASAARYEGFASAYELSSVARNEARASTAEAQRLDSLSSFYVDGRVQAADADRWEAMADQMAIVSGLMNADAAESARMEAQAEAYGK